MKKVLMTFLVCLILVPAYAQECKCDLNSTAILEKIKSATWFYSGANDFAYSIYQIKDQSYFKAALKSYIETNCTVQNNKIQCR